MRVLLVGDVHATANEVAECRKLIEYVREVAVEGNYDVIHFLGDQYHNHHLVHLAVMQFWMWAFDYLAEEFKGEISAQVGNHDKPGQGEFEISSMSIHKHRIMVFDGLGGPAYGDSKLLEEVLVLPHMSDQNHFIAACEAVYAPTGTWQTIIAHQTFDGSIYENGFYAKDGIDQKQIPQPHIISGHIHTPQQVGKVWYPGSPRWRTLGDANQDRGIWGVTFEGGVPTDKTFYSTAKVCKPIFHLIDTPESPVEIPENGDVVVDICGPKAYVEQRKRELEGKAKIRGFPNDGPTVKVKESEGVPTAFTKFLAGYKPKNGTDLVVLENMARDRISWLRA